MTESALYREIKMNRHLSLKSKRNSMAALRAEKRAAGLRPYELWLSPREREAIDRLLQHMRGK